MRRKRSLIVEIAGTGVMGLDLSALLKAAHSHWRVYQRGEGIWVAGNRKIVSRNPPPDAMQQFGYRPEQEAGINCNLNHAHTHTGFA